jgi:outer membrane lipoprotein LolB
MRRRVPILSLLVLAALLAGCAATDSRQLPDLSDWETRKAYLEHTDEWEFAGRIGVSAGSEGFNGKLWWRQDGDVFRARISGPIGIGTIFINGDGPEVTLTERDGTVTELMDAEAELRYRYGWTIPVTSLRFWTLGIPDPSSPADVEFNEEGQMSELSQREWQVTIGQYVDGGGQAMPRRLTAVSDDIRVRLVIDGWTFR